MIERQLMRISMRIQYINNIAKIFLHNFLCPGNYEELLSTTSWVLYVTQNSDGTNLQQ